MERRVCTKDNPVPYPVDYETWDHPDAVQIGWEKGRGNEQIELMHFFHCPWCGYEWEA